MHLKDPHIHCQDKEPSEGGGDSVPRTPPPTYAPDALADQSHLSLPLSPTLSFSLSPSLSLSWPAWYSGDLWNWKSCRCFKGDTEETELPLFIYLFVFSFFFKRCDLGLEWENKMSL